jgi:hypothetical protein
MVMSRFSLLAQQYAWLNSLQNLNSRSLGDVLYEGGDALRVTAGAEPSHLFHVEIDLELSGFVNKEEQIHDLGFDCVTSNKPVEVNLDPDTLKLLGETSVRARLVKRQEGEKVQISNWRWVENILADGVAIRIARAIHDAEINPLKFDEVVRLFWERDDLEGIIKFLAHCNIPMEGVPTHPRMRVRAPVDRCPVGPRIRMGYCGLREAMDSFYNRHERKLKRHLQEPSAMGRASFLRILETIQCALNHHWEYELSLLPSTGVITPGVWTEFRDQAGSIFARYLRLIKMLVEYVDYLETRDLGVSENLDDLREFRNRFISRTPHRVKRLRESVQVRTESGNLVKPPLFSQDILHPTKWQGFKSEISDLFKALSS